MLLEDKIPKNTAQFKKAVETTSRGLGINPDWLMLVMYHESKLDSTIENSIGAVGLIQFLPSTMKGLKVTADALKRMSNVEQMQYVYKYFSNAAGKLKSPLSLFMYTFYPYALKEINNDNYVFGSEKSPERAKIVRDNNKGFDLSNNGVITMRDYKNYHYKLFQKYGLSGDYTPIPDTDTPTNSGSKALKSIAIILLVSGLAYGGYRFYKLKNAPKKALKR